MSLKPLSDSQYNRSANLRQHLLRASRNVNSAIVEGLHLSGFAELSSTHTALLSNLDLDGSSLTLIAKRAGMTKQAMGRLADELINLKYIRKSRCKDDKRVVKIEFTPSGLELMKHSFMIMADIENRCKDRLGVKKYNSMLASLQGIVEEFESALL